MQTQWVVSGASPEGFTWQGGATEQGGAAVQGEGIAQGAGVRAAAVIGEPNFTAIWWLELALGAARSVARVKLGAGAATGFLVAPDLLLTNHHVLEDEADAAAATLQFNYRLTADWQVAPRDEWSCDADDLFHTNVELDYTLVRVAQRDAERAGDTWGFLDLRGAPSVNVGQRVNIIQHPQGRFQEIAFRDNNVEAVLEREVQYLTDTEHGTSGAPVFDDRFRVVALHSQGVPDPGDPLRFHRNQGTRAEAIIADAGDLLPG